jgi:nucleoid-associated protein YgaU
VLFAWGSLTFTCVLARAAQRFIMFRPDGVPIRARLQVTFNEFRDVELEAKEIKRETADYTKRHTVGQDETLSGIAAATYGDASMWRPIAIRNGIDDPRELAVGLQLAIPSLPYRDPDSGEVFA